MNSLDVFARLLMNGEAIGSMGALPFISLWLLSRISLLFKGLPGDSGLQKRT